MAPTTFADRVATEERLLEHLKANEAELEARGLHVGLWISGLESGLATVKDLDRRQEALKAELKATTQALDRADESTYRLTSGGIDATVAAWGKGTPQGESVAQLRSKLHRPNAAGGTIQPVPIPPQ